jgi:hypothetical protein
MILDVMLGIISKINNMKAIMYIKVHIHYNILIFIITIEILVLKLATFVCKIIFI